MKNINILIFIALILFSCSNGKSDKARNIIQKEANIQSEQYPKKLTNQNDSLQLIKSGNLGEPDIFKSIDGKYLSYTDPNSAWVSIYYFFDNHIFILDYGDHSASVGKWELQGDSIIIEISKISGKRGVGEPIHPGGAVPAVYFYEYEEYVPFCEDLSNRICLDWNTISKKIYKKYIDKTDGYCEEFCGIGNITSDNVMKKFLIQLDGDYTFASERYLSSEDLNHYSIDELRLIRNEIYARYGYIFKSKDLESHFKSKKWYKPGRENVDDYLSGIEESNIRLIKYREHQLSK